MSDDQVTETVTETSPETVENAPVVAPETSESDWENSEGKGGKAQVLKELREARDRIKELSKYEEAAKAAEQEKLSETEKLQNRIKELEQRDLDAMRLEIALEKGLSVKQAKRLVGSTLEELAADADDLLEVFGTKKEPISRKPSERLQSGSSEDEGLPEIKDPVKLAALIQKNKRL